MHLASPETGSADWTFFSVSYVVWRKTTDDDDGGGGTCPGMLPFEIVLPEVFMDKGQRRMLPPTFDIPYSDVVDIRTQCKYLLQVVVERKASKLALWKFPKR